MRILFIGDIFGSPGRRIVADHLQDIVKAQGIDLAIANAENSAGGFGVTPSSTWMRTVERRQPSAAIRFRAIEMDDPASRSIA